MESKEALKPLVRKDNKGNPRDGDMTVCVNLLKEVRRRAELVIDHSKKVAKYTGDIADYLKTLEERGVFYLTPAKTNPNPPTPPGSGQVSSPLPSLKKAGLPERKASK